MFVTLQIIYPMFLCSKIGIWNSFLKNTGGKYWAFFWADWPDLCIGILLDVFREPARFSRTGTPALFMAV
jgi:hypothetical protein